MRFNYEGFNKMGQPRRGTVDAEVMEHACEKLRNNGLHILNIQPEGEKLKTVLPEPSKIQETQPEPAGVSPAALVDGRTVEIIEPPVPVNNVPMETEGPIPAWEMDLLDSMRLIEKMALKTALSEFPRQRLIELAYKRAFKIAKGEIK